MLIPIRTQVRVLDTQKTQAGALTPTDLELVVAPLDAGRKTAYRKSTDPRRWTDEAIKQFAAKLSEDEGEPAKKTKDSASTPKDEDPEFKSVCVQFTSGGASGFLFVPPNSSTFDLHTELKKAFGDLLTTLSSSSKTKRKALLDLRGLSPQEQERVLQAFCILSETLPWEPEEFGARKSSKKKGPENQKAVELMAATTLDANRANQIVELGLLQGQANNLVRTLADLPANELTPLTYRKHAQDFARKKKLKFEFWGTRELMRKNAGAFLAVTRADPRNEAGIVKVTYPGRRPRSGAKLRRLALIGKGICFDTGGYNIKVSGSMLGMHGDMTGSALALALCGLFAELEVEFEVTAYLALAENLISPTAYKPNEVVIASDGTSIEVVDTDAEGRMILADALALARKDKPDLAIDFATLTYASMRSLDTRRSAVFSNRPELARLSETSGDESGERTWSFPLSSDYRRELKSKIADILQCSSSELADHIYAATFLAHFIGKETPWVHMDLASASNKGGLGLIGTDTTGFGVLWAWNFVEKFRKGL